MRFLILSSVFMGMLILTNCSSVPPEWRAYKVAMKCHFEGKNDECVKHYEKAIRKSKSVTPTGLHASYGAHLYRMGNVVEAEEEFKKEIELYPQVEKPLAIMLKKVPLEKNNQPEVPDTTQQESLETN
ncbi:MAG: DUF4810 domain-containing protein [Fibrobacteria bacterium]|nr:DUF4810 domain-containing protein [Fibrobacteria bacterium]